MNRRWGTDSRLDNCVKTFAFVEDKRMAQVEYGGQERVDLKGIGVNKICLNFHMKNSLEREGMNLQ